MLHLKVAQPLSLFCTAKEQTLLTLETVSSPSWERMRDAPADSSHPWAEFSPLRYPRWSCMGPQGPGRLTWTHLTYNFYLVLIKQEVIYFSWSSKILGPEYHWDYFRSSWAAASSIQKRTTHFLQKKFNSSFYNLSIYALLVFQYLCTVGLSFCYVLNKLFGQT